MGLLDSQAMRFIFSNTDYMKRRYEQENAARAQGLIGTAGQDARVASPDGSWQAQDYKPASGYLGGQMNQQELASGLLGIPGYQQSGAALLGNQNNQQGAMARQKQEQDYSSNNMSMFQKGKMQIEKARLKIQESAARINASLGYDKNRDDLMFKLHDRYAKKTEQFANSMNNIGDVNNILEGYNTPNGIDYQSVSGTDGLAIQSKFLNTIRPGEAQMEGDLKNLAKAMGFKGEFDTFMTWLSSNKNISGAALRQMHMLIEKQAMLDSSRVENIEQKMSDSWNLSDQERSKVSWGVPMGEIPSVATPRGPGMGVTPQMNEPNITWDK